MTASIQAQAESLCESCRWPIAIGQPCTWSPSGVYHPTCAPQEQPGADGWLLDHFQAPEPEPVSAEQRYSEAVARLTADAIEHVTVCEVKAAFFGSGLGPSSAAIPLGSGITSWSIPDVEFEDVPSPCKCPTCAPTDSHWIVAVVPVDVRARQQRYRVLVTHVDTGCDASCQGVQPMTLAQARAYAYSRAEGIGGCTRDGRLAIRTLDGIVQHDEDTVRRTDRSLTDNARWQRLAGVS